MPGCQPHGLTLRQHPLNKGCSQGQGHRSGIASRSGRYDLFSGSLSIGHGWGPLEPVDLDDGADPCIHKPFSEFLF